MEANKNNKKIMILGISLLILAGIIIIALKGLNVSLMYGKHEAVEIKLDSEVDLIAVEELCKDVFGDKKFVVKGLEVFNDSVQINVESLTDEEKNNLIQKINEKFQTDKSIDDLKVYSVSNKRIRDTLKLYIKPIIISFAMVFVYILIRFRKINSFKIIIGFIEKVVFTEAVLLSIAAIIRLPISDLIINLFIVVAVLELVLCVTKNEKKLQDFNEEE